MLDADRQSRNLVPRLIMTALLPNGRGAVVSTSVRLDVLNPTIDNLENSVWHIQPPAHQHSSFLCLEPTFQPSIDQLPLVPPCFEILCDYQFDYLKLYPIYKVEVLVCPLCKTVRTSMCSQILLGPDYHLSVLSFHYNLNAHARLRASCLTDSA